MHYSQVGALFGLLGAVQAAILPQEKEVRDLLGDALTGVTGAVAPVTSPVATVLGNPVTCGLPLTTSWLDHTLFNG